MNWYKQSELLIPKIMNIKPRLILYTAIVVLSSDARFQVHLDSGSDSDSRKIQKSDSDSDFGSNSSTY